MCEACSGWLPRTSLSSSVSGLIHCFLSPQRNPLYSSPGRTPGSLGMLSDSCVSAAVAPEPGASWACSGSHRLGCQRRAAAAALPFRQQEAQPHTLGQEAPALAS